MKPIFILFSLAGLFSGSTPETHPPGPPMTLGNMRERGVQNLIASCLNDACRAKR